MSKQHFIGFADLTPMFTGVPQDTPVYLNVTSRSYPTKGKFVYDIVKYRLLVQVIDPQGMVRYVQHIVAQIGAPNGVPWEHEMPAVRQRVTSAERIVRDWLTARGWTVLDAEIAMPRTLILLETRLSCLRYDKQTGTYLPADQVDEETA